MHPPLYDSCGSQSNCDQPPAARERPVGAILVEAVEHLRGLVECHEAIKSRIFGANDDTAIPVDRNAAKEGVLPLETMAKILSETAASLLGSMRTTLNRL